MAPTGIEMNIGRFSLQIYALQWGPARLLSYLCVVTFCTFSTSPAYNHFFIWNVIKTSYMNLEKQRTSQTIETNILGGM